MGSERSIAGFEDGTPGDAQFFLQCFNAISHKQVLTIKYGPFGAEAKERIIHPYYLKQYLRRWYLYATIEGKEFVTCFSLDRVRSARINNEVEYRESAIDFNHYFDDIVGVTHPQDGVVEEVVVEGDSWAEYYLRTLPIHPLQQLESLGEEGCRVTMRLMVNRELEREILSYGEHLRVKAPEHFRQRIIQLHKTLSETPDDSGDSVR
jgi:predicted DNA-binding transcriptional regulator YafY